MFPGRRCPGLRLPLAADTTFETILAARRQARLERQRGQEWPTRLLFRQWGCSGVAAFLGDRKDGCWLLWFRCLDLFGQSKIKNLHLAFAGDNHIAGFQVAMQDSRRMSFLQWRRRLGFSSAGTRSGEALPARMSLSSVLPSMNFIAI